MKIKDITSIESKILTNIPGFATKGPLMFIVPVSNTLRGIYFEDSATNARSFYVWAFLLPLYIPIKQLSFNLGKRLRGTGGERWNADSPTLIAELSAVLKREAIPFLSRILSPHDLVEAIRIMFPKSKDPYVQQAIAYAHARNGNIEDAINELEKLVYTLDNNILWHREIADRAKDIAIKLQVSPSEALKQLKQWEVESIHNLRLDI